MSKIISMELAARIWNAHREIAQGTKLRDDLAKAIADGDDPTPRDWTGRRRGYSLGVPSGESSERLLDVEPKLAVHVIDAHVAAKQKELQEACIAAAIALGVSA